MRTLPLALSVNRPLLKLICINLVQQNRNLIFKIIFSQNTMITTKDKNIKYDLHFDDSLNLVQCEIESNTGQIELESGKLSKCRKI